jgi:hypothetical protein
MAVCCEDASPLSSPLGRRKPAHGSAITDEVSGFPDLQDPIVHQVNPVARGAGSCSISLGASAWTMAPCTAPMRSCCTGSDGRPSAPSNAAAFRSAARSW